MAKEKREGGSSEQSKKIEEQASIPEKKESTIDNEYFSMASRYFNRRIQQIKERENLSDDDQIEAQLLEDQKNTITKIAYKDRLAKIQPGEIVLTLGRAIAEIENAEDVIRDENMDEEIWKNAEKDYQESKELLEQTGRKIFPNKNTGLDTKELTQDFKNIYTVNGSVLDSNHEEGQFSHILSVEEIEKRLAENPRGLLEEIDKTINEYARTIQFETYRKYKDFQEGDSDEDAPSEQAKANAVIVAKAIYGLQTFKDKLIGKIYGKDGLSPLERRNIDKEKSNIK